jgi:HSP20 family protein
MFGPAGKPKTPGKASSLEAMAMRGSAPMPWWLTKEDGRAVTLLAPMPGLGKEHVKVWVDQDMLMIKGDGTKERADGDEDDHLVRNCRYNGRFKFEAPDEYKMDQIRAEMKNGLLRVTVPKVVDEERTDVSHVAVE